MDTRPVRDDSSQELARREAIRRIHAREQPAAIPDGEVQLIATEELAGHSPDGRPADRRSIGRGRLLLGLALVLGLPGVMVLVALLGGIEALLMGVVYAAVLVGVSFPVWYSGLIRHQEEREASEIVRVTLTAERVASESSST